LDGAICSSGTKFPSPADVRLFAFDERGRPVDPGAVAAW
jgi:hypothetical protein